MPKGIEERALAHLAALLRIDTTNPPGNEEEAAGYVAAAARACGAEPRLFSPAPGRGNCVVRVEGTGERSALLLNAHLDVVPAGPEKEWTHPPFGAAQEEGFLWGRGALDMKHMAAMMLALLEEISGSGGKPRGDVVFAWTADEERGGTHGARWLVENRPALVDAEHGIGEAGGFTVAAGGRHAMIVQTAEKGIAWLRVRARGESGHGSMPDRASAVVRLAGTVAKVGRARLPVHMTAATAAFLDGLLGMAAPGAAGGAAAALLPKGAAAELVRRAPQSPLVKALWPMMANTAAPTVLRAGESPNVIPSEAEAVIDGRTVPGQTGADLVRELRAAAGDLGEVEVIQEGSPVECDHRTELFRLIGKVVRARVPSLPVLPYLNPGFTDAKWFTKLGMTWYGFTPLPMLPPHFVTYNRLIHSADERVPVEPFTLGARLLHDLVAAWSL